MIVSFKSQFETNHPPSNHQHGPLDVPWQIPAFPYRWSTTLNCTALSIYPITVCPRYSFLICFIFPGTSTIVVLLCMWLVSSAQVNALCCNISLMVIGHQDLKVAVWNSCSDPETKAEMDGGSSAAREIRIKMQGKQSDCLSRGAEAKGKDNSTLYTYASLDLHDTAQGTFYCSEVAWDLMEISVMFYLCVNFAFELSPEIPKENSECNWDNHWHAVRVKNCEMNGLV